MPPPVNLATYRYGGNSLESSQYPDFAENPATNASTSMNEAGFIEIGEALGHATKPTQKWSLEELKVLFVIKRFTEVERTVVPALMNQYFPNRTKPFEEIMASAQFSFCKKRPTPRTEPIWKSVFDQSSFRDPPIEIVEILNKLQKCATKAKIPYRRKSREDAAPRRTIQQRQRTVNHSATYVRRTASYHHRTASSVTRRQQVINHRRSASVLSTRTDFLPLEEDGVQQNSFDSRVYITIDDDDETDAADESNNERGMRPLESLPDISELLPDIDTPSRPQQAVTSPSQAQRSTDPQISSTISSSNTIQSPGDDSSPQTDQSLPIILFRAWSSDSAGINSPAGFRAFSFASKNDGIRNMSVLPPNIDEEWFLHTVAGHYAHEKTGSFVVSTTSSFLWILKRCMDALKYSDEAVKDTVHFSVIDTSKILPNAIYSGKHMHARLMEIDGAIPSQYRKYKSVAEYLVWSGVPQDAMLTTIKFRNLQALCTKDASVRMLLHLEIINEQPTTPGAARSLKETPMFLDATTFLGFAELLLFLGITPTSPSYIISGMTSAIVYGLCVNVDNPAWIQAAFSCWVAKFQDTYGLDLTDDTEEEAQHAFIAGVQVGLSWKSYSNASSKSPRGYQSARDLPSDPVQAGQAYLQSLATNDNGVAKVKYEAGVEGYTLN